MIRSKLAKKTQTPGLRLRRLRAMSLGSRLALLGVLILVVLAILAPFISPYEAREVLEIAQPPSAKYPLGTTGEGYDVLSSMLYGARFSVSIGLGATLYGLLVGTIIGSIAAVSRKSVSEAIMRVMDIIMSVPGIALAAVLVTIFSHITVPVLIFAIGSLYIPQLARVVRANVISEYGEDYVRAVIVSGARAPWILIKHVARNTIAPVLVYATVLVADAIVFEASLAFINAGLPTTAVPTWGNLLNSAQLGLFSGNWWQATFPGIAIMLTVLCLNILSEGMTDAIVAAPKGQVDTSDVDSNARREADLLVADPVAAYAKQHDRLVGRLAELRKIENQRTDRLHYDVQDRKPVLQVRNLCIKFPRHGDVNVVDNLSFDVYPGQTMGLVGESGCGKSISSFAVMGLLGKEAELSGQIMFGDTDLLKLTPKQHNALRGHEIAMIYQDALSSLNPSMLIKAQMKQLTKRGGTRTAEELLHLVGLDPKRVLESYPHELSGGQRQRVLIAMALTRDPKLVIADEPTTALDVTVQKQVIELLNKLRDELGFAMLFVSHDLALVAEVAHSITVMYAGQVVEQASTQEILTDPRHEYTRGLLGSVLSIEAGSGRLHQVPGSVPSPADFPKGDRFAPRSSHPTLGLEEKPHMIQVPGTYHFYASQAGVTDNTDDKLVAAENAGEQHV